MVPAARHHLALEHIERGFLRQTWNPGAVRGFRGRGSGCLFRLHGGVFIRLIGAGRPRWAMRQRPIWHLSDCLRPAVPAETRGQRVIL